MNKITIEGMSYSGMNWMNWVTNTKYTGIVQNNETDFYFKDGRFHRSDCPAVEDPDGTKEWWFEGRRHREGGPAVEYPNGTKCWYKNGKLHREDGPAKEWSDGYKQWWLEGVEFFEFKILDKNSCVLIDCLNYENYKTVKLLNVLFSDKIREYVFIPGMNKYGFEF
jgi:hypothetical protein